MTAAPGVSSTAAGAAETARLDALFHAALARGTGSQSLASAILAAFDWSLHLAVSPGKCLELLCLANELAMSLASYSSRQMLAAAGKATAGTAAAEEKPANDRRFADPAWQHWPYGLLQRQFLAAEQWWQAATHGVWGVEPHHAQKVAFAARQLLDMLSPGNQLATNPVVLQRTLAESGLNLWRGAGHVLDDWQRQLGHAPPAGTEAFVAGRDVAITPGTVVLRNRLIELIQYTPTTPRVKAEPILIVPAWIMKYYVLDLSPADSLVKYLVDQGHTVFCISWHNPGAVDRDLGLEDYLQLGVEAALSAVNAIVPQQRVHAVGYCLGGTLLAMAAAAMARDGDHRLASLSLFCAQTDFTEPGELGLFIDESQVSLLEAQMAEAGTLSARQMAGAFQMLRSYDLLWSRMVNDYLLGRRLPASDLIAWNADATRMPAHMHSQYLRRLFLHNDLAEGRFEVGGRPVDLQDLALPIFAVGTETDHVAPWRSVYKLHHLVPAEIRFVLTSGGHNAGIVSPPGVPHRHYRMMTRKKSGHVLPPSDWLAAAPQADGSWWPAWQAWLGRRSGADVEPPRCGLPGAAPLGPAPGRYVLET